MPRDNQNALKQESDSRNKTQEVKTTEAKLTEYLKQSLDKVAIAEGFINYDLKVDLGSSVGDGFVGLIYKATIYEIDDGKRLNVVLKLPPFSKARRNDFGAMELFEREIFIYNVILPEFVKIQRENNIEDSEGFFNFPKCYLADYSEEKDDAVIIMEDLRENGYAMWDKYKPVDLDHTKLLVAALGRYNAVSFAIKAQKPKLFEKLKSMKDIALEKYTQGELRKYFVKCVEQAVETIDEKDIQNRRKVSYLAENYSDIMRQLYSPELSEPYTVARHGDCWSNNFMYQYENGSVQKAVMLDWQVSYCSSPVLDLANFIFSCTDGNLRAQHYDELLKIYHQSLKDLLDRLGGDTEAQFPFSALLQQFKQFGKFAVIIGSVVIPGASAKNEDFPERDLMADGSEDKNPGALCDILTTLATIVDDSIKLRLRDALMDVIDYGYL